MGTMKFNQTINNNGGGVHSLLYKDTSVRSKNLVANYVRGADINASNILSKPKQSAPQLASSVAATY